MSTARNDTQDVVKQLADLLNNDFVRKENYDELCANLKEFTNEMREYVQELRDSKRDNCKDIEYLKENNKTLSTEIKEMKKEIVALMVKVGIIASIPIMVSLFLSLRSLLKP